MPFQTAINLQQAPATNGDFATNNPRSSAPSDQAAYVAGSAGIIVSRFCWIDPLDLTGRSVISSGTGKPLGFIARTEQALITTYLSEFGNTVPGGFGVTVYQKGDYYILVNVQAAVRGYKAFANNTTGIMQPAPTGTVIAGYTETDYTISVGAAVGELAIMSL
jgi:hypothetical protein